MFDGFEKNLQNTQDTDKCSIVERTKERLQKFHEKNIVTKVTSTKVGTPSHLKNFQPKEEINKKELV